MDELTSEHGSIFFYDRKKSLDKSCSEYSDPTMQKLPQKMHANIILYFHDSSCVKIVSKVETYVKFGAAKYGQAFPIDFEVPAQQTKIPAEETKYF